jgi:hypothetical protein
MQSTAMTDCPDLARIAHATNGRGGYAAAEGALVHRVPVLKTCSASMSLPPALGLIPRTWAGARWRAGTCMHA